ncbi:MAG: gamma-glutamyl-gamma-aminobutyrate hydrolase family protein [Proteobacteria bacterium]|nr:gamma-glutamyl-gamma-aminobutyrate hydrolase family protein [Pseudomonadota bacterium]
MGLELIVSVVGVEGEFVVRDADSPNPAPSPQSERRFAQSVSSSSATRRPVIGITGYAHIPENAPLGLPIIGARSADVHAVQLAGGLAFLLPPISDADEIDQVLDLVDGLLFTGGRDVDPAEYGESPVNDTVVVTPERDAFELPLMRRAVARDLPVLAICRGCQVMGVALGGSLWQDLPSDSKRLAWPFLAHCLVTG